MSSSSKKLISEKEQPSTCKIEKLYSFIDIGANLTDPIFRGLHHDEKKHDDDFLDLLQRSVDVGMEKMVVTASNLPEAEKALELAKQFPNFLFSTVGVHPCRASEFEKNDLNLKPEEYLQKLITLLKEDEKSRHIVAIGEFGLDYDRFNFCDKATQQKYFEYQFELCSHAPHLPLFLHNRNTGTDFVDTLKKFNNCFQKAVVHSFTGSKEELELLLSSFEKGKIYIGINGCSLKTKENLDVVKLIPKELLLLETDAPWCEIRATHAGNSWIQTQIPSKKKFERGYPFRGRNEPCYIVNVLEIVAKARNEDPLELSKQVIHNTYQVFFPHLLNEQN